MAERAPHPVPVCTLLLVCAATLLSAAPHSWAAPFVLERQAALDGEGWRLLTGHLWHGDAALAVWDLGALALLGAWVERRSRAELLATLLLAALLASAAVLGLRPDLASYQGSSALSSALLVLACLHLLGRESNGFARAYVALALALLAAKVALEGAGLWPSVALAGNGELESVALAHLAGGLAGGGVRLAFDLADGGPRAATDTSSAPVADRRVQSPETRTVNRT